MPHTPSRSNGFRIAAMVLWQLRLDLLGVAVVAVAMALVSRAFPFQAVAAVVPLLGVVVSIFIGFKNSNAFNRWWEARTLWSSVIANCRAFNNAATAVDDGSAPMAVALGRMRRRQVRHVWQLAAELRGVAVAPAVHDLTPEDPENATAGNLLTLQAADTRDLVHADHLDRQGRVILTNLNTAQSAAVAGLERIRHQQIPAYYSGFVRGLAWLFGVLVCTRVDAGGHHSVPGIVIGLLIMALFVVAERLGHLAEGAVGNSAFALPTDDYCADITADLLGSHYPLAANPDRK